MTYYRQPWGRLTVTGRRCRLQVLDPVTAFELEPQLIERFGEHAVMLLAARGNVLGSLWSGVLVEHGIAGSFVDAAKDPEQSLTVAMAGLRRTVSLLTTCAKEMNPAGPWLAKVFERMAFDRLKVDGMLIEDWADWAATGLGAAARWRLFTFQIEQTFQPLWTRKPYSLRTKGGKDYGVSVPDAVPMAAQWANNLAKMGYVASAHDVLVGWTPMQLMDAVDMAAYQAEIERRAMETG